jgi:hypothetical protein
MLPLREQRRRATFHVPERDHGATVHNARFAAREAQILYSLVAGGHVKKCASCTKDLPDAALHCVFCGAKQPPAPAVQQGMAKTAFGYSANEMIDQLKQQPRPGAPAPYSPPRPQPQPMQPQPYHPPTPAPPMAGGSPSPYPLAQPLAPAAGAHAATMYAGPPPQGPMGMGPGPSMGGPYGQPPMGGPPQGYGQPPPAYGQQQQMPMPIPPAQPPPYLASQTAARAGRPIEPWKDSLRLMMFVWGAALLAAFAAPFSTDPMIFSWNIIAGAEGTAKLPPLIIGAVGLLSIVIASIPMQPAARGLIAAVLGLAGAIVPVVLVGMPPWTTLISMVGMLVIVPALLVRNEYRESSVSRILVTVGAIALLLPLLVPQGGTIPLVALFKLLIDMPGAGKLIALIPIIFVVLVVLTLLAWVPAPATGAAKLWAWLLILFGLFALAVMLIASGSDGFAMIKQSPAEALSWITGMAAEKGGDGGFFGISVGAAYSVLFGYGLATVIGKQLE